MLINVKNLLTLFKIMYYTKNKILERNNTSQIWLSRIQIHIKIQRCANLCAICMGAGYTALGLTIYVYKLNNFFYFDILLIFAFIILSACIQSYSVAVVNRGCKLLKSNHHTELRGMIGCLCETFNFDNFTRGRISGNSLADAVCFALTKALPCMQTKEWEELTPHQRSCLHNILYIGNKTAIEKHYGTQLVHAVLSTLKRVGDETSLNHVQNVAEQTANPYLRQLALDCAASIQARVQHSEVFQTLLRPSASVTSPDMLLRPASGTAQPDTEATQQLLRSSTGGASCASNDNNAFLPEFSLPESQEEAQHIQIGQQPDENTP